MKLNKTVYDIFISYRHSDTADKAEHLMTLLEGDGYKGRVSFDRENLDGRFDLEILRRLDSCTDFIVLLGGHTLDGLKNEDTVWYKRLAACSASEFQAIEEEMKDAGLKLDFVRLEIARAITKGKHIIPIVPVASPDYNFDNQVLPEDIKLLIKEQAEKYQDSKDFLFKDVSVKVRKRLITKPRYNELWKWLIVTVAVLLSVVSVLAGFEWKKERAIFGQCRSQSDYEMLLVKTLGFYERQCRDSISQFRELKGTGYTGINDADNTSCNDSVKVKWSGECSLLQIRVIKRLINYMMLVPTEKAFHIGKYEVSEREWNVVMRDKPEGEVDLPMRNISWHDCQQFVRRLQQLTCLVFTLPSEEQWEIAARYGEKDGWIYAGGDDAASVATFEEYSEGGPSKMGEHDPNFLEIYDMSGNVSEWCSDGNSNRAKQRIRGGSYLDDKEAITTTFVDAVSVDSRLPQVGVRIVLL